jgi:parallel beta-helix repeat protein
MRNLLLILLLAVSSAFLSAIQVSGNQSGTWSPDNNPYEIVGDVTVPAGLTLTVQPGVVVHAMGLYQIIAQGNIIAVGTATDSIYFVSGQANPTALWDGIRLENTSVQSQFTYCRIDLGDYGINSINSPVSITYCHFKNNKRGIQAYGIGSANPANVLIDHNLIELTVQNGILVAQNSNTTITNNEITRNGTSASYYGAIQLSNQSAGGSNNPTIAYNHIHHNYKQGIIAWDIVSANAINPEVHHNLVENNLTGIYFRHSSGYLHHNTVINNFIPGDMNSGAGIMVSGSTAQPYFEDNTVTGNYTGFYLTENANPVLGDLSIYHAWAQGGNIISNNIDANNVMHSIYCYSYTNSAITIKAENNFWDYNTALEIAGTIEDNNDNASLPTIDFDPWQNNAIPIYLAGTVTMTNPPVPTATLELVSAQTGNILNTWEVNINQPFQVPVYHDSLVYIVAHATDMIEQQYYGAYGGTDNPTATQIIADVQFSIGDLPVSMNYPNWYYWKIGSPQLINDNMSYPLQEGWFVYAPNTIYWLFRDSDYLRINRIVNIVGDSIDIHDLNANPIWRKIQNLGSDSNWQQYMMYDSIADSAMIGNTNLTSNIEYFPDGISSSYHLVVNTNGINTQMQIYDNYNSSWIDCFSNLQNGLTYSVTLVQDMLLEPDGTLFPLQTGNKWKRSTLFDPDYNPSLFGYRLADSVSFYWIPAAFSYREGYRIYDNGTLLISLPMSVHNVTLPIPNDGLVHHYTLCSWLGTIEYFAETTITLDFTSIEDEVQPVNQLSIFPNPFNPLSTPLTIKHDFGSYSETKVAVYNLKGQLVWSVMADKGATELTWDGRDNHGKTCASGIYQLVLNDSRGKRAAKKLMLLR